MANGSINFVAYSDIHHHSGFNNGLQEEDLLNVEDQVLEYAIEHKVDFILNLGDRFLLRNPISHIRALADEKLVAKINHFPLVYLLGNHDRESKNAFSGHSMMHFPLLFANTIDLNYLHIIDKVGVYSFNGIPDVEFHAVPAGQITTYEKDYKHVINNKVKHRIMIFHDIIRGSTLGGGTEALHGADSSLIDSDIFSIVLGGDNHVNQKLNLSNTTGYYIGAPCQHNWGDSGQERGFLHVTLGDFAIDTEVRFVQTKHPKFIKVNIGVESRKDWSYKVSELVNDTSYVNNIVHVTIGCSPNVVGRLDLDKMKQEFIYTTRCRTATLVVDSKIEFKPLVYFTKAATPIDDWCSYIESGQLDLGTSSLEDVVKLGIELIHEASS
jgi:exonuclease SbcD